MLRRLAAIALLLLLGLGVAQAERKAAYGDYEVHYNAFPSGFLKPEVAQASRLVRSRQQGVLTVSVLKNGQAVSAQVRALATNEAGQLLPVALHEIRDGDAIYQIGNVRADDGEVLRFELDVLPEGASAPFKLRFTQQFFAD